VVLGRCSRRSSTYAPYERDFVLVQWDQRGAGRTFARHGTATPDLTLPRLARDGMELAEYLRRRFGGAVVVLGHSWGTAIATGMVRARPELFAAYVGTGQIASWPESVQAQFDFLSARARETGNAAMRAEKVEAPSKRLVVLEDAGHFALVTHAPAFVAALRDLLASIRAPAPIYKGGAGAAVRASGTSGVRPDRAAPEARGIRSAATRSRGHSTCSGAGCRSRRCAPITMLLDGPITMRRHDGSRWVQSANERGWFQWI
jgi:pimeloyl-ACP methyl ester carboxylesterase